jgi:uncharacterized membrane-anchored protein
MDKFKQMLNKVPEVTVYFWIIKILCTTVGETFADFLDINLNIGLTGTSIVIGVLLVITLFFQFRQKKYVPGIYWLSVALISVFGTLVTDNLTDAMGVPLEFSTILFSILLAGTFILWYRSEKTLSIHSIFTTKREVYYWLTILFTFALGTATGDLMAEALGLGYLLTGLIVAVVIFLSAFGKRFGLNSILSFWIIYIMTRPLGASIGDYLSQPNKYRGLGLGPTTTSIIFIGGILTLVTYLAVSKRDVITDTVVEVKEDDNQKGGIKQTIAVVVLLLVVAIPAYFWRQNNLQNVDTTNTVNETGVVDTSNSDTASPLGDLSGFKKITEDTLLLIQKEDFVGAKTRVSDLEYEWDNAESKLKSMNKAKWVEVDDAIDAVLRQVRAVNPNKDKSVSALDELLSVLK